MGPECEAGVCGFGRQATRASGRRGRGRALWPTRGCGPSQHGPERRGTLALYSASSSPATWTPRPRERGDGELKLARGGAAVGRQRPAAWGGGWSGTQRGRRRPEQQTQTRQGRATGGHGRPRWGGGGLEEVCRGEGVGGQRRAGVGTPTLGNKETQGREATARSHRVTAGRWRFSPPSSAASRLPSRRGLPGTVPSPFLVPQGQKFKGASARRTQRSRPVGQSKAPLHRAWRVAPRSGLRSLGVPPSPKGPGQCADVLPGL